MGIFDMKEMAWSDGYDADAAAYEVPQVVKQSYQSGSAEPAWSDDTVKALFANSELDLFLFTISRGSPPSPLFNSIPHSMRGVSGLTEQHSNHPHLRHG